MEKIIITNESYQYGRNCIRIAPNSNGYFVVQNELNHLLIMPLKSYGYEIPNGKQPEISLGKYFSLYLRENCMIDKDEIIQYEQTVNNNRKIQITQYSNRFLGAFREFFLFWLKNQGYQYFKRMDKKVLPLIDKIIQMNSPLAYLAS